MLLSIRRDHVDRAVGVPHEPQASGRMPIHFIVVIVLDLALTSRIKTCRKANPMLCGLPFRNRRDDSAWRQARRRSPS
jgi:hypothetical protein